MSARSEQKIGSPHTLFTTALLGVNPEPSADTTSFRTWRHPRRDLEVGVFIPDACMVYTEDGEIFRLDLVDVRFVCDRQRASLQVPQTLYIWNRPKRTEGRSEFRIRAGIELRAGASYVCCNQRELSARGGRVEQTSTHCEIAKSGIPDKDNYPRRSKHLHLRTHSTMWHLCDRPVPLLLVSQQVNRRNLRDWVGS